MARARARPNDFDRRSCTFPPHPTPLFSLSHFHNLPRSPRPSPSRSKKMSSLRKSRSLRSVALPPPRLLHLLTPRPLSADFLALNPLLPPSNLLLTQPPPTTTPTLLPPPLPILLLVLRRRHRRRPRTSPVLPPQTKRHRRAPPAQKVDGLVWGEGEQPRGAGRTETR